MKKGINTAIEETKVELVNFVNEKVKMGIPISVMGLIISNLLPQISNGTLETINAEKEAIKKQDGEKPVESQEVSA